MTKAQKRLEFLEKLRTTGADRVCKCCGKPFRALSLGKHRIYCGPRCTHKAWRDKQ